MTAENHALVAESDDPTSVGVHIIVARYSYVSYTSFVVSSTISRLLKERKKRPKFAVLAGCPVVQQRDLKTMMYEGYCCR